MNAETMIIKPFSINGKEYWGEAHRRSKGVLRVFPDSMEIEVEMFQGCDPDTYDLFGFVLKDKDVRYLIRKYQQSERKRIYAINISSGMSGRVDIYINFYDKYGLETNRKHLIHISCAGKIHNIRRMYIGDFVEALYAYGIKKTKTTAKYIKPYFATESAGMAVNKII